MAMAQDSTRVGFSFSEQNAVKMYLKNALHAGDSLCCIFYE